ncbi:MAG: DUF883 family protein [Rhizobiaceae bacterium]|nr:DUF883 family protein [Rhizobiaceae bacterium]
MAASAGTKPKAGTTEANTAELKAEITKLREELADLAKHVTVIRDKSTRTARQAAGEKAEELRAQGEAAYEELRETALDYEKQLNDAVREKPITSLAIAAAVGFFFALVARR